MFQRFFLLLSYNAPIHNFAYATMKYCTTICLSSQYLIQWTFYKLFVKSVDFLQTDAIIGKDWTGDCKMENAIWLIFREERLPFFSDMKYYNSKHFIFLSAILTVFPMFDKNFRTVRRSVDALAKLLGTLGISLATGNTGTGTVSYTHLTLPTIA